MKDRYELDADAQIIHDIISGEHFGILTAVARLNTDERVLARVIEVVEQREEA
jgi:hypothetical protein